MNAKVVEWSLRIGLFGLFVGHGAFGILGKKDWIGWISNFTGGDLTLGAQLLLCVGILDVLVGFAILIKPIRIILLWAAVWTLWTAVMRILPFIGAPVWDTVERLINPAAVIALLYLRGGIPTPISNIREWFK